MGGKCRNYLRIGRNYSGAGRNYTSGMDGNDVLSGGIYRGMSGNFPRRSRNYPGLDKRYLVMGVFYPWAD